MIAPNGFVHGRSRSEKALLLLCYAAARGQMEYVWRASPSLGKSAQIFTGLLYNGCVFNSSSVCTCAHGTLLGWFFSSFFVQH